MGNKIKLLVVDDDRQFLDILCKRLERRAFEVTSVNSGEEAIEIARKERFDIALVDWRMPRMDGEQVLETLKKEHMFMEVIILTAYGAMDSVIIRSARLGVFRYLEKPCELDELVEVLEEAYQK